MRKFQCNIFRISIFYLISSFLFSGCDAIYRFLDKEGAQEKELVGEVLPLEKNSTIEEIQTFLEIYGYNPGKIDGILGLRTRNAIERFQIDRGVKPTRFADQKTWQKLKIFKENKLILDRHLNVSLIQKILNKAGFDPGPNDGKLGQKTKKAVLRFQESHLLKVDGKIGYQTLKELATYLPL